MSAPKELIKIGEFARQGGTNLRTLRYYEELGLIRPASRTGGGIRYYRRNDLNRLRMIGELQTLGLTLERIRELIAPEAIGAPEADRRGFLERVRAALDEQRRLLDENIVRLEKQRRGVDEALAKIPDCCACTHLPGVGIDHCEPCRITGRPLPSALSALF